MSTIRSDNLNPPADVCGIPWRQAIRLVICREETKPKDSQTSTKQELYQKWNHTVNSVSVDMHRKLGSLGT
jgi:diaminopimelate epimerase